MFLYIDEIKIIIPWKWLDFHGTPINQSQALKKLAAIENQLGSRIERTRKEIIYLYEQQYYYKILIRRLKQPS